MRAVRSAAEIRDLLQEACASRRACDDCYLGVVRTDADADGCNWNVLVTPLGGDRDACVACVHEAAAETRRLRATLMLPPSELTVREIESLQAILAVRELGVRPGRAGERPLRAIEKGYVYVADDGRLDVSRAGREMLRRL